MRPTAWLGALGLVAAGCGGGAPGGATDVALAPPPSASVAPPSTERVRPEVPRGAGADFTVPDRAGPRLGEPCESEPDVHTDRCGRHGRIAVEVGNAGRRAFQPREAFTPPCAPVQVGPAFQAHRVEACVVGDHLYLDRACVMCRLPNAGETFYARLDELTESQHAFFYRLIPGEGDAPHDARSWRAALARLRTPDQPQPSP